MDGQYVTIPQPNEIPTKDKEDAMGAYLMMFAALAIGLPFPVLNLIAAIVYYYINRKKGRFIHFHLLQSLYSQIPTTILNIIAVSWFIKIIILNQDFSEIFKYYLLVVIITNITYFIFSIYASVKARKGEFYFFPLIGKIAYQIAFSKFNKIYLNKTQINTPPKF